MTTKESITLQDYRLAGYENMDFKVKSLNNMIDFKVGQALMEQDVRDLINKGIQVKIVECSD